MRGGRGSQGYCGLFALKVRGEVRAAERDGRADLSADDHSWTLNFS